MYISRAEREEFRKKKLKEALEDDIKVKVDDEVVVDTTEETTEEKIKATEAPKTNVDMAITDMLSALIKDELEAIEGYNSAIQTIKSIIDEESEIDNIIKENLLKTIKVLEDIAGEEYMHIGQAQEVQKLFSTQVDLIAEGEKEAQEQLSE